jgi:DNA-directed RNA polymerase subunit RPC12/RpoP
MIDIDEFDFDVPSDAYVPECSKCGLTAGLFIMDYDHENLSPDSDVEVQFIACPRCGLRMVRFVFSRNGNDR